MTYVRIRGGLVERMRFLALTDPAITRKRSIAGEAIKNNAKLRVVAIEPLGMVMRMYDITTGTGDFIANGVVSHNCFARPTHKYLDFDAGRDFEREIVVKVNAPEVVRAELARPSWKHEHVAMGTNTDPYQWVEGRYRLMPGIWEALRDASNPCSVLTKSPLLLRDLPIMLEIAARTSISASLSIPTLDQKAWRATEPHTPNPRARLEAVAELNRAGIPTGVLIAPLMPGINDAPEQIEPLLQAAVDAGATSIGGIALHLRGDVRQIFMDWLRARAARSRRALRGAVPPRRVRSGRGAPTARSARAQDGDRPRVHARRAPAAGAGPTVAPDAGVAGRRRPRPAWRGGPARASDEGPVRRPADPVLSAAAGRRAAPRPRGPHRVPSGRRRRPVAHASAGRSISERTAQPCRRSGR